MSESKVDDEAKCALSEETVVMFLGLDDSGNTLSLMPTIPPCSVCGDLPAAHEQHVRFLLPEPVLRAPEQDRTPGTWMSHGDANASVMMQVPDLGPFVRVLLPVRLHGGDTITFGLWMGVHPDDFQRAFAQWWAPTYPQLVLDGRIANDIQPWGLFAKPATAVVRDENETPYLASSPDRLTDQVLKNEWPHNYVLHSDTE